MRISAGILSNGEGFPALARADVPGLGRGDEYATPVIGSEVLADDDVFIEGFVDSGSALLPKGVHFAKLATSSLTTKSEDDS